MRIKYLILLSLGVGIMACGKRSDDYIIVVEGMRPDTSSPRRAVELNPDRIFFCTEIVHKTGFEYPVYTYHAATLSRADFAFFEQGVRTHFTAIEKPGEEEGFAGYQLVYKFGDQQDSIVVSAGHLLDVQYQLLDSMLSLGRSAKNKIAFHDFPEERLFDKLDWLPLPDSALFPEYPTE